MIISAAKRDERENVAQIKQPVIDEITKVKESFGKTLAEYEQTGYIGNSSGNDTETDSKTAIYSDRGRGFTGRTKDRIVPTWFFVPEGTEKERIR